MKKVISISLLAAFGLAAQAPAAKAATKPARARTSKKTAAAPKPVVIPKDAVARPDGTYAWSDAQGKSWIFVRTPFGVMKTANSASPTATNTNSLADVKTFDAGDKVRFETNTPFGIVKREKSKTDLTDEERSLYTSQNPSPNAKQD